MLPDRYEVHARVVPTLILVGPALLVAALFGASPDVPLTGTTLFGAMVIAGALVAGDAVSDVGRSLQDRRWSARGGSPTVRALLASDPVAADRRERIRQLFDVRVTPGDQPSAERASTALRDYVRTTQNPRVAEANRNYGRVRNLCALRAPGFVVATTSAFVSLLPLTGWVPPLKAVGTEAVIGCAVVCACVALWWLVNDFESQLDERDGQFTDRILAALDTAVTNSASGSSGATDKPD